MNFMLNVKKSCLKLCKILGFYSKSIWQHHCRQCIDYVSPIRRTTFLQELHIVYTNHHRTIKMFFPFFPFLFFFSVGAVTGSQRGSQHYAFDSNAGE